MIVDVKGIKDSWKEYMEKLINEEPAVCIMTNEVSAALKKMNRHKAPGISGLVAEMIQCTGDIRTHWVLDLCNGIVKKGCILEIWKSIMVLPMYISKGDPIKYGSYRGIKLSDPAM